MEISRLTSLRARLLSLLKPSKVLSSCNSYNLVSRYSHFTYVPDTVSASDGMSLKYLYVNINLKRGFVTQCL